MDEVDDHKDVHLPMDAKELEAHEFVYHIIVLIKRYFYIAIETLLLSLGIKVTLLLHLKWILLSCVIKVIVTKVYGTVNKTFWKYSKFK